MRQKTVGGGGGGGDGKAMGCSTWSRESEVERGEWCAEVVFRAAAKNSKIDDDIGMKGSNRILS